MIFVVGNSRSGTTMMGRILGNHPKVFTFGELHFFGQLWSPANSSKINLYESERIAAKLLCIQTEGYRTHGNSEPYLQQAKQLCENIHSFPINPPEIFSIFLTNETIRNNKTIPCDQTPRNVFYINEILIQFPDAKIINMIRDPRDVLYSQKRKWKRRFLGGTDLPLKESIRDWVNYHPITISRIWNTAVTAADNHENNNQVITIYFEKLLENPENTVKTICDFCEIHYSSSLLKVPQVGSSEDTDKPQNLGINPNRAGNWKNADSGKSKLNSAEVYINQILNRKLMKKHNYTLNKIRPNIFYLLLTCFTFPIKVMGAFFSNLDRIKNIKETLRRRL